MKVELLSDISTVSLIKPATLSKLENIAESCLCDYLVEASLQDEDLVEINIGIGTLSILTVDNELQYQFRPSQSLEKKFVSSYTSCESPIVLKSEEGLEARLLSAYKELF